MGSVIEPDLARYARQIRFAPLGEEGQRRLLASRALVCGCGALGSVIANTLVRSGVGKLRIVDRDFLELNNLQRQVLFDEDDLRADLPKAVAAANKLRRINSEVEIEPLVVLSHILFRTASSQTAGDASSSGSKSRRYSLPGKRARPSDRICRASLSTESDVRLRSLPRVKGTTQ